MRYVFYYFRPPVRQVAYLKMRVIESIKTTSMEDVSTGVLEKIKSIYKN